MRKAFDNFDENSKAMLTELAKENKKFVTLVKKLKNAKEKVNKKSELTKILN